MCVSPKRAAPLDAENRARLLRAADDRPLSERLLAYLVLEEGLTIHQAISLQGEDVLDDVVTMTSKTGKRESRPLSPTTAGVIGEVRSERASSTPLVTGRSGLALSAAAGRRILLALAAQAGVPVRSIHELPRRRVAVAA